MRKVEDYLKHAAECREMASRARGSDEREMLLNMAETWESLARDRHEQLRRLERIKNLDDGIAASMRRDEARAPED